MYDMGVIYPVNYDTYIVTYKVQRKSLCCIRNVSLFNTPQVQSGGDAAKGGKNVKTKPKKSVKAKTLLEGMTSARIVGYACFLHDVLSHLSKLSGVLQRQELCIGYVHQMIEIAKSDIQSYAKSDKR